MIQLIIREIKKQYWIEQMFIVKKNKEKLREKARNKYRELFEGEKNVKREYGWNRYYNMSDVKKTQRYQKIFHETNKSKKSWFLVKQYINSFLILWIWECMISFSYTLLNPWYLCILDWYK